MDSSFKEWTDNSSQFPQQKLFIYGDLSLPIGLVNDKTTGERIDTAYILLYRFKIEIDGEKKSDLLLHCVYETQYLINFEKGKTELKDFIELCDEAIKRLKIAFKNRVKGTRFEYVSLNDFKSENSIKPVRNLFEVTLLNTNLR